MPVIFNRPLNLHKERLRLLLKEQDYQQIQCHEPVDYEVEAEVLVKRHMIVTSLSIHLLDMDVHKRDHNCKIAMKDIVDISIGNNPSEAFRGAFTKDGSAQYLVVMTPQKEYHFSTLGNGSMLFFILRETWIHAITTKIMKYPVVKMEKRKIAEMFHSLKFDLLNSTSLSQRSRLLYELATAARTSSPLKHMFLESRDLIESTHRGKQATFTGLFDYLVSEMKYYDETRHDTTLEDSINQLHELSSTIRYVLAILEVFTAVFINEQAHFQRLHVVETSAFDFPTLVRIFTSNFESHFQRMKSKDDELKPSRESPAAIAAAQKIDFSASFIDQQRKRNVETIEWIRQLSELRDVETPREKVKSLLHEITDAQVSFLLTLDATLKQASFTDSIILRSYTTLASCLIQEAHFDVWFHKFIKRFIVSLNLCVEYIHIQEQSQLDIKDTSMNKTKDTPDEVKPNRLRQKAWEQTHKHGKESEPCKVQPKSLRPQDGVKDESTTKTQAPVVALLHSIHHSTRTTMPTMPTTDDEKRFFRDSMKIQRTATGNAIFYQFYECVHLLHVLAHGEYGIRDLLREDPHDMFKLHLRNDILYHNDTLHQSMHSSLALCLLQQVQDVLNVGRSSMISTKKTAALADASDDDVEEQ